MHVYPHPTPEDLEAQKLGNLLNSLPNLQKGEAVSISRLSEPVGSRQVMFYTVYRKELRWCKVNLATYSEGESFEEVKERVSKAIDNYRVMLEVMEG